MGLPVWLWWLFIPLGASVLIGGLAFGVGHMIRQALPHHDPDCGCSKCAWEREIEQARIEAAARLAAVNAKHAKDDEQSRRPQGRVVSTRALKPGARVLVSGSAYMVDHVAPLDETEWEVQLINAVTKARSRLRVPRAMVDIKRWELA